MIEKFEQLPTEKRNLIINESLKEFAKGYDLASTNNIIKNAKISKGLLFHYFTNKEKLYLYLIRHTLKISNDLIKKYTKDLSNDLFEIITKIGIAKMKVAIDAPLIYEFLLKTYFENELLVYQINEELTGMSTEKYFKMWLENMDKSKFKDGVDAEKVIKLIYIILEGTMSKYTNELKNLSTAELLTKLKDIEKEIFEYFDLLKKGIYIEHI